MSSSSPSSQGAMRMVRPLSWTEAIRARGEDPDLLPIAGGTDVMVELNFGRRRPLGLLDLTALPDLEGWRVEDGTVVLDAGLTYAQLLADVAGLLPGLAMAARTVGSPQIRNRGTVAGNLASASPAGDALPPLVAGRATVELEGAAGVRELPVADFLTGVKRSALAPDELIRAVRVPVATGPQQFAKIGTRNAMVIAVASFALTLDPPARRVGTGLGSVAPTVRTAPDAEEYAAGALDWDARGPLPGPVRQRFAELVAAAARPVDDHRGTAAYRRHALGVLAARTLGWAWDDYRAGGGS